MRPLDRVPAIRRIDTDRSDFFAVEVAGEFTAADVENLFGLLEGAYALHDRIDVLVRAADYEGADWEGVDPDTIAEGRRHAERYVARCAVVGGPDWTRSVGGLFSADVPVELRYFEAADEDGAWEWLRAREVPQAI